MLNKEGAQFFYELKILHKKGRWVPNVFPENKIDLNKMDISFQKQCEEYIGQGPRIYCRVFLNGQTDEQGNSGPRKKK